MRVVFVSHPVTVTVHVTTVITHVVICGETVTIGTYVKSTANVLVPVHGIRIHHGSYATASATYVQLVIA
ncbi:hypothetical protein GW750_08120 [bacterium]|nr:hypothetical protein [bacterium]